MTRIIAGRAGSITLDVPGVGTRPTSDRVRESLFAALESADVVRSADVLDLYAGSGALGLEALSRGAASVDLVEKSPRSAAVTQRNATRVAAAVGAQGAVRVHRADVGAFLHSARKRWDLVLIDPPYALDREHLSEVLTALTPLLEPEAVIVIERATRSAEPDWGAADLEALRDRRYGDTTLWWGQPRAPSPSR